MDSRYTICQQIDELRDSGFHPTEIVKMMAAYLNNLDLATHQDSAKIVAYLEREFDLILRCRRNPQ